MKPYKHAWLEKFFGKPLHSLTRGELQRHNLDWNASGVWLVREDEKICDSQEGERACWQSIARYLQEPPSVKKNPRPHVSMSGRKQKLSRAARAQYPSGMRSSARRCLNRIDPRKRKKLLRKAGFRVNPDRTFKEWSIAHQNVWIEKYPHGGWQVFSRDPELWHLKDYRVAATLSGRSVLLVSRKDGERIKIKRNPAFQYGRRSKRIAEGSAREVKRTVDTMYKASRQVFIQAQSGDAWKTIALVKDTPEMRVLAKRFAKTYKRKHPASVVRVITG